jgi:hypothetical protein
VIAIAVGTIGRCWVVRCAGGLAILGGLLAVAVPEVVADEPSPTPEARALGFLAKEVPRWSRENGCFSCHNNGDAARALYMALRANEPVPLESLADTTRWLGDPGRWDHNGGDGVFSDKRLARLQFASALATALAAGQAQDRRVLIRAARRIADDQGADGAFLLEGGDALGAPATYGRSLATLVLRDTLRDADPALFRDAIGKAERWLTTSRVESLLDASAVLPIVSGPGAAATPESDAVRRRCLDLIRRGQSTDGGWGPYPSSPPEPFDTAVVLLALVRSAAEETGKAQADANVTPGEASERLRMIERGRAFLIATQNPDGSWPETTRPAGDESYAQRLSTAGWATLALLATREPLPRRATDPER